MNDEKRTVIVLRSLAALLLLFVPLLSGCAALGDLRDLEIATPADLSLIADGTYQGEWDATLVRARVAVEMGGGRIFAIDLIEHDCGKGEPAEAIVDAVIDEQSLSVDTVSGATASSKTILKAIEVALSSAPRR